MATRRVHRRRKSRPPSRRRAARSVAARTRKRAVASITENIAHEARVAEAAAEAVAEAITVVENNLTKKKRKNKDEKCFVCV
jgi:hypothetical protein